MSVSPIESVIGQASGASGLAAVLPSNPAATLSGDATGPTSFGDALSQAVTALQTSQTTANALATGAATGNVQDIHDYTIAANEASLMIQTATAIRDRLVDGFNEIMRLQA